MTDATLDELWSDVQQAFAAHDWGVFPVALIFAASDINVIEWPDDDWQSFLDVAARARCRLIYAEADRLDASQLPALGQSAEGERLRSEVEQHVGRVCRVDLGFAVDGMLHAWHAETSWLAEIDDHGGHVAETDDYADFEARDEDVDEGRTWRGDPDRRAAEARIEAEKVTLQPTATAWVALLVEHPQYIAAKSKDDRWTTAREIIPELQEWYSSSHSSIWETASYACWQQALHVRQLAEDEVARVKARRVEGAKEDEIELADAVRADPAYQQASSAREREMRVREFVTKTLGFPSPDITLRLGRLARLDRT